MTTQHGIAELVSRRMQAPSPDGTYPWIGRIECTCGWDDLLLDPNILDDQRARVTLALMHYDHANPPFTGSTLIYLDDIDHR